MWRRYIRSNSFAELSSITNTEMPPKFWESCRHSFGERESMPYVIFTFIPNVSFFSTDSTRSHKNVQAYASILAGRLHRHFGNCMHGHHGSPAPSTCRVPLAQWAAVIPQGPQRILRNCWQAKVSINKTQLWNYERCMIKFSFIGSTEISLFQWICGSSTMKVVAFHH